MNTASKDDLANFPVWRQRFEAVTNSLGVEYVVQHETALLAGLDADEYNHYDSQLYNVLVSAIQGPQLQSVVLLASNNKRGHEAYKRLCEHNESTQHTHASWGQKGLSQFRHVRSCPAQSA